MFRQGIKSRYLHKHATFLWLSLCLAIFLSSLPQKALFDRNIFSCSHELDQSLQPVQTQIGTNDSIPFSGWVLSAGKEGQPLSFLSRIRASNRFPAADSGTLVFRFRSLFRPLAVRFSAKTQAAEKRQSSKKFFDTIHT